VKSIRPLRAIARTKEIFWLAFGLEVLYAKHLAQRLCCFYIK